MEDTWDNEMLLDQVSESWTGMQLPWNIQEDIRESKEESEKYHSLDSYRAKGPIFERDGKWIFRIERITEDTYGP